MTTTKQVLDNFVNNYCDDKQEIDKLKALLDRVYATLIDESIYTISRGYVAQTIIEDYYAERDDEL